MASDTSRAIFRGPDRNRKCREPGGRSIAARAAAWAAQRGAVQGALLVVDAGAAGA
jgi:hypothetical protein